MTAQEQKCEREIEYEAAREAKFAALRHAALYSLLDTSPAAGAARAAYYEADKRFDRAESAFRMSGGKVEQ